MEQYQAIVLAAGQGKRMELGQNKQLLQLGDRPLIAHTLSAFEEDPLCRAIYLVVQADEHEVMEAVVKDYNFQKVTQYITGGAERQDSVRQGVEAVEENVITYVHDGARPFVSQQELHALFEATKQQGAAFLATPVTDTVKQQSQAGITTLDRNTLFQAQTPQTFQYDWLKQAHDHAFTHDIMATDDVALLEEIGLEPVIVEGSKDNFKLTNPEDIQKAENMLQMNRFQNRKEESSMVRIGQGFDVHQLVEGRPCIIGGIEIPYAYGLKGHSDADVLLHTIADAALGAIGRGDIGRHFPDDDPQYEGYDSKQLLKEVWEDVEASGYTLGNVDCTIMAQAPKMAPYVEEMRGVIASILNAQEDQVNVKATTTEKLGFTGRKEGIAAQAVILLHERS